MSVEALAQAIAENDETKTEMWRGQILTNIDRFAELKAKWRSHPIVEDVLRIRGEEILQ